MIQLWRRSNLTGFRHLTTFKTAFLLWLLSYPVKAQQPQFDAFLPDFRRLYTMYHMGPKLPSTDVDRIALRIWTGSGHNWEFASTTACQGICESHYTLSGNKHLKYRGHIGMHLNTIFAEGVRIGVIKKNHQDLLWLLRVCKKDPSYADFLSASRLVFLTGHFGSMRIAIFQYVTGHGYKTKKKDFNRALDYWMTVQRLREDYFGVPLTGK